MTYSPGPTGKTGNKLPKGYKAGQLQQYTPEMMELWKSLFAHLGPDSYTSRLASGDPTLFEEMEAPAKRQFQGTLGNIASKFSGMGMGGRRSSGFGQATTSAASDFAQELQSKRQGLQRDAIKDLMSLSSLLLGQNPYEKFLYEKEPDFFTRLLGAGSKAGGAAIGGYYGGPKGAMAGYQAGSGFSQGMGWG